MALVVGFTGCGDDDNDNGDGGPIPGEPVLLDPATIPKFAEPLPVLPEMPPEAVTEERREYRIAVRQFEQQILPAGLPATTVWGYGREGDPSTFHYPGWTVETRSNQPVRVTWLNQLVDDNGRFRPHLLPVDTSIHWANPGGTRHRDHDHGDHDDDDVREPYRGPVPIVIHVHGAHSFDHSDGHPEAWWLPDANNLPDGFATRGPTYRTQAETPPGSAVFDYPQDENAATLWYHDHVLGMTRVNIYAGLSGFWLIRDDIEDALGLPGPAPRVGDAPDTVYREIPIAIADRTFQADGSLFYPTSRSQYDGYDGPVAPDSEVPPIWGPEFIGNTIVVNGRTWPFLEVEPRLYRFRFLNASDARTLMLALDRADLSFVQVGADGGLLPDTPLVRDELLLGVAERVDVLVDFSSLAPGETVTLVNRGPDEPWGGPDAGQAPANPETTGLVMEFRVVEPRGEPQGTVPEALPAIPPLSTTLAPRDLVLAEEDTSDGFPVHVRLGTLREGPLPWAAPATEIIQLDSTEIWRVANTTDDAHPIHLHLIDFEVLDRIPYDADAFSAAQQAWLDGTGPLPVLDDFVTGPPLPRLLGDIGPKDTVLMYPGTITRIIARFDRAGSYVWHCHIIEHEDNDMMRPLEIVP